MSLHMIVLMVVLGRLVVSVNQVGFGGPVRSGPFIFGGPVRSWPIGPVCEAFLSSVSPCPC